MDVLESSDVLIRNTTKLTDNRNSFCFFPILKHLEKRVGNKMARSLHNEYNSLAVSHCLDIPHNHIDNSSYALTTKFSTSYSTKAKSPMLSSKWFKDGTRIISGNSCGELAIWNQREKSIEIGFSAHDTSVQCFEFNSTNDFIVSVDHGGFIKYWQSNLNFIQQVFGHTDPARDISFSPTDEKFVTCGDDGYIKVWDFEQCKSDISLSGHGSEVKCVDWHPTKGLIASGAKDSQQPVLLWDPRTSTSLCTLHMHNNAVNDLKWNKHGNFLATCSKDKIIKLFDIRTMTEFAAFRGHKTDIISIAWNPIVDKLFVTGSLDGSFIFWDASCPHKPMAVMENVHEGAVWSLSWHPLGHYLVSSSNDCTNRIWERNNIGDGLDTFCCISHKSSVGLIQSSPSNNQIPGLSLDSLLPQYNIPSLLPNYASFLCHEPILSSNTVLNNITNKEAVNDENLYLYDTNIPI